MNITFEINIPPKKVDAAREIVEAAHFKARKRLNEDVSLGRKPTQVETDNLESLGIASALLGSVRRAMP